MSQLPMAGHTVVYNGVQIGGSDSEYSWHPPTTEFTVQAVYDEADRAIVREVVVMSLRTIIVHDNEQDQDRQVWEIRKKLMQPGKKLNIAGMGIGFLGRQIDTAWGPKPRALNLKPIAPLACSVEWILEFSTQRCLSNSYSGYFESLVFASEWAFDREGKATRIISGKVGIPKLQTDTIKSHVDAVRDRLKFVVPVGFERIATRFSQSLDKRELSFSVSDRELVGNPLPVGIIDGAGQCGMQTSGPGFARGTVSLSMSLTTAPGVPRGWASLHFFREVMAKQRQLARVSQGKQALIPMSMSAVHSLFGRESAFSFVWQVTGCLVDLLMNDVLYRPVEGTSYQQWFLSVQHLWGNRGVSNLYENPAEDAVIDVCKAVNSATIGATSVTPYGGRNPPSTNILCDHINENNSWLYYDTVIRAKVSQSHVEHHRAVDYVLPDVDSASGSGYVSGQGESANLGLSERNVLESIGRPEQRFLLQWKGLRVRFKPEPPKLISIGGRKAIKVKHYAEAPKIVTMALGCPVYFERSATEYVVIDPVSNIEPIQNKSLCYKGGEKDKT